MILKDDRTDAQLEELPILIGGEDPGMSGWGEVPKGISYAYWACSEKNADRVEDWVESRGDIDMCLCCLHRRENPPIGTENDHCHIYCVTETHPSLQGEN